MGGSFGNLHTVKNTEASVGGSKGTGLEGNADKTKYIFVSRDQNAGKNQNVKN